MLLILLPRTTQGFLSPYRPDGFLHRPACSALQKHLDQIKSVWVAFYPR